MRFKLTLLLVILNLTLFGFLYYLDKTRSASTGYTAADRLVLSPGLIQTVEHVSISSSALDDDWIFQRSGAGQWLVENPFGWRANRFAIDSLLSELSFLRWDTRFSLDELERAEQGLATYGLEEPSARIQLENDNRSIQLLIGSATEIGNRLYILSPDERHVMVVQRDFFSSISQDLTHYLEPQLIDIPPFEIRALQVQIRDQGNIRTRILRESNQWRFESPINTAADNASVSELLDQLYQLEATDFFPEAPPESGLDRPAMRLTAEAMTRRTTLLIGNPVDPDDAEGPRYAQLEGYTSVFLIETPLYSDLEAAQENLRERRFLRHLDRSWTSVEIRSPNRQLTLQRLENGQWQVLYTNEAGVLQSISADRETVEDTLNHLHTLEAEHFASDAPSELDHDRFGLSEPQRMVRIQTADGRQVRLRIGNLSDDEPLLYADTDAHATVYQIDPLILSALPLDPLHFRDRLLRSLPESASVTELRLIDRQQDPATLRSLEADEIPDLLDEFAARTRVDRYLSVPFSDPLQIDSRRQIPWRYALEIDFLNSPSADSPRTLRFFLTERLGGTRQFAALEGERTVFNLPEPIISAIDEWIERELPEEPAAPETPQEPSEIEITEEPLPEEGTEDPGS